MFTGVFEKQKEMFDQQREMLFRRQQGVSEQRKVNDLARERLKEEKASFEKRLKTESASLDAQLYLIDDEDQEIRSALNTANEQWNLLKRQWNLLAGKAEAKSPKSSQRTKSESLASETVAVENPILDTEAISPGTQKHSKTDTDPVKITREHLKRYGT